MLHQTMQEAEHTAYVHVPALNFWFGAGDIFVHTYIGCDRTRAHRPKKTTNTCTSNTHFPYIVVATTFGPKVAAVGGGEIGGDHLWSKVVARHSRLPLEVHIYPFA